MKEQPGKLVDAHKMFDHLSRIILRMVPFLPVPELYDLVKDLTKSRTDLDQKITRAQASLTETSDLIEELELGLDERVTKLSRLKGEYEKYSQLAEVGEEKARAIIQQIELTIGRDKGKERIITLALNLVAGIIVFILGVALGPHLTQWIGITGK